MSIFQPKAKRKIKVRDLNDITVCYLCEGYLIRPVAVTECLHTFCRSCLVGFLESASEYHCPQCYIVIHETNPWEAIKEDKTLEDIIMKLIPGLQDEEKRRRLKFYEALGMQVDDCSQDGFMAQKENSALKTNQDVSCENQESNKKSPKSVSGSQIGFCLNFLEPISGAKSRHMRNLDKKYIRCSSNVTVEHLKKYVSIKLMLPSNCSVDILCNGEIMGRHHTLEFIFMTRWRFKESLLYLEYRPKLELAES